MRLASFSEREVLERAIASNHDDEVKRHAWGVLHRHAAAHALN